MKHLLVEASLRPVSILIVFVEVVRLIVVVRVGLVKFDVLVKVEGFELKARGGFVDTQARKQERAHDQHITMP